MIRVRKAMSKDVDDILRIEEESFTTPWSRKSLEMEVTQNQLAHYLVVEENYMVVGYGGFWKIADEAHIGNIAIAKEYRRKGFGKILMKEMVSLAKSLEIEAMTLEVRPSNEPALRLYSFFDFYHAGIRKNYYSDTHEDGWILWKELKDDCIGD